MKPAAKPVVNREIFVIIVKLNKRSEVFKNLVFGPRPIRLPFYFESEMFGQFVSWKFFGDGFYFPQRK